MDRSGGRPYHRGVRTPLLALAVVVTCTGCPDWSRPDPRLKRAEVPVEPAAPAAPAAPAPATVAGLADEVAALKERAAKLGPDADAAAWKAVIETLERLETRGQDALERGTPAQQAEAEAALLELTVLRDDLVRRQPRRAPDGRPGG